jgi:hypothetical protein
MIMKLERIISLWKLWSSRKFNSSTIEIETESDNRNDNNVVVDVKTNVTHWDSIIGTGQIIPSTFHYFSNESLGKLISMKYCLFQHRYETYPIQTSIIVISCVVGIIIVVYFWIQQRWWWYRNDNAYNNNNLNRNQSLQRRRRLRSNSYSNEYYYSNADANQRNHNRNRSYSNDSGMKPSPRSRIWSNSFPFHNNNNTNRTTFDHPYSRRRLSSTLLGQHSSMDIVREMDVQQHADDVFWETLQQEEIETRQRQNRDRINSKQSTGSKGNNNNKVLVPNHNPLQSSLRLLGPSIMTMEYNTIAPPPTWSKASRNLILSDKAWDLSRIISLQLLHTNGFTVGTSTLMIQKAKIISIPKKSAPHKKEEKKYIIKKSVTDCSIHVHNPQECGVLYIYVKGTDPNEWMEHTFHSASAAAQFQLDLLALQIIGPSINHLYSALRIIHQGSDAYSGNEPVLHHVTQMDDDTLLDSPTSESNTTTGSIYVEESGIAWDDVMRCLGSSFPSIRLRLEAMRWLEVYSSFEVTPIATGRKAGVTSTSTTGDAKDTNLVMPSTGIDSVFDVQSAYARLNPEYRNQRRLLLGPVDFFRLFVPKLHETAVPEADCSRIRMEQLLRLRKRVARAAVLVGAYTRAKVVVNQGWNIVQDRKRPEAYWKRRYAFDDDIDNQKHDYTASNEYYEGTVSRDVDCQVRGLNYRKINSRSKRAIDDTATATSLYQAYSLVGIHSFQWSSNDEDFLLHYKKDPVHSISSLKNLIARHPGLDFFVFAVYLPSQDTAIVHVYVRSLPKGIDPKFDQSVCPYRLF